MLAGSTGPRPRTLEDLLPAQLTGVLDRLDVLSRKVLSGKLPGERRSKRRGRSVEFDDFRAYVPGDDPRHIDWNILARLDRLVIKLFREEEDLALNLVIDESASMDAGDPGKLAYVQRLAFALAYVGLVNQNRVSVSAFGAPGAELRRLAPLRGRPSLRRVADFMLEAAGARPGGTPTKDPSGVFLRAMRSLGASRAGSGITVVISDMLFEPFEPALNLLAGGAGGAQHDSYLINVLSPGELDPHVENARGLYGDLRLIDVETGQERDVTVTPATLRAAHGTMQDHLRRVRGACLARGIAWFSVSTATPVQELLLGSLRRGGLFR